jgi:nucleoid DNA-binding protein
MGLMSQTFSEIGDALSHGEDVYLEGFGRFYPDCKPPRKVKSGLTEETHMTKFKVFVRFNAFKQLNNRVQEFMHLIGLAEEEETDDV